MCAWVGYRATVYFVNIILLPNVWQFVILVQTPGLLFCDKQSDSTFLFLFGRWKQVAVPANVNIAIITNCSTLVEDILMVRLRSHTMSK